MGAFPIRGDVYYWGSLMAGALLGSIPIAMIYSFFLDYCLQLGGAKPTPLGGSFSGFCIDCGV